MTEITPEMFAQMQQRQPKDRKDLKIQALLERVRDLTTQYENQAADYRVEITTIAEEVQRLTQENQQLQQRVDELEVPTETEDSANDSD